MVSKKDNVVRFNKLKLFIKKILPLLDGLNLSPKLWGSFAYVGYTSDFSIPINDADFLVPRSKLKSLISLFKKNKIKFNYVDDWECIQIFSDGLMIEFDPIERYDIKSFETIDFGDFKLKAISSKDLMRRYKLGSEDPNVVDWSKQKVLDYKKKHEKLKVFLTKTH